MNNILIYVVVAGVDNFQHRLFVWNYRGQAMQRFLALLRRIGWQTVDLSDSTSKTTVSDAEVAPTDSRRTDSTEQPLPHVLQQQSQETLASA